MTVAQQQHQMQFVSKVWGQEQWIVNADGYCGKILRIYRGMRCSLHMHSVKDETFYVQEGVVELEIGPAGAAHSVLKPLGVLDRITLASGSAHRIPPLTWHRFSSRAGATVFEFSTHHDDADVVRAEESGRMPR